MIGIANRATAATIERARRLYTGVDPDTGKTLTAADSRRMGGLAIADACDVHPHTVDGWIQRFGWRRPHWYRRHHGFRPLRPGAVREKLIEAIERAATERVALPDNLRLARQLQCSLQSVMLVLRTLRAAGLVHSERIGPRRRLVLKDGRATSWSNLPVGQDGPGPVEPRLLRDRVLEAVQEWVAAGVRMPTAIEGGKALGCHETTLRRTLCQLRASKHLSVERRSNSVRYVLPDGRCTGWSAGVSTFREGAKTGSGGARRSGRAAVPVDLVAADAVRALQCQGFVVFDVAVVKGCAWGVSWSIDGKVVPRKKLMELAAVRRATAMQRLSQPVEMRA